jgi:branched-chain amino acid transport system permease protein
VLLLRRIYHAPELFQLLATFALVLVVKDVVLWLWGPEELLGPRAAGFAGSVEILGRKVPSYDLLLIVVGPLVLGLLTLLLTRTRWGTLVRAATQDRDMVAALGVNQAWLFTSVFALGALLAGLGGALQLPREPANLELDLHTIGAAFVVVVVGGMGSIPGAFVAALLIAEVKAICVWIGLVEVAGIEISFSKLTLVVEFLVMAAVLILRPWGLMGRAPAASRHVSAIEAPLQPPGRLARGATLVLVAGLALLPVLSSGSSYTVVLAIDLMVAALFAASLHFIMGPAGMHSFGHAAYFGLAAYGAALLVLKSRRADGAGRWRRRRWWPPPLRRCSAGSACGCPVCTWPCSRWPSRRSPGPSFQWDDGHRRQQRGHRRLAGRLADRQAAYYAFTLVLVARRRARCCAGCCSRPSAWRCAPGATRRCGPMPSAST